MFVVEDRDVRSCLDARTTTFDGEIVREISFVVHDLGGARSLHGSIIIIGQLWGIAHQLRLWHILVGFIPV